MASGATGTALNGVFLVLIQIPSLIARRKMVRLIKALMGQTRGGAMRTLTDEELAAVCGGGGNWVGDPPVWEESAPPPAVAWQFVSTDSDPWGNSDVAGSFDPYDESVTDSSGEWYAVQPNTNLDDLGIVPVIVPNIVFDQTTTLSPAENHDFGPSDAGADSVEVILGGHSVAVANESAGMSTSALGTISQQLQNISTSGLMGLDANVGSALNHVNAIIYANSDGRSGMDLASGTFYLTSHDVDGYVDNNNITHPGYNAGEIMMNIVHDGYHEVQQDQGLFGPNLSLDQRVANEVAATNVEIQFGNEYLQTPAGQANAQVQSYVNWLQTTYLHQDANGRYPLIEQRLAESPGS